MSELLAGQRHWLEVRRLSAYTPELDPVEGLWANLKGHELASEPLLRRLTWVAQDDAERRGSTPSVQLSAPCRPGAVRMCQGVRRISLK